MQGALPLILLPGDPPRFPDPRLADHEGLVAVGGDLTPARLLAAYDQGIFPWYDAGTPPMWWSPDPRALLPLDRLHQSRSLARTWRRDRLRLTWNRAFRQVVEACSQDRTDGTWLIPEMIEAYSVLHALGHAHSLEVWHEDRLVGGLYGVQRGGVFAAESKFHRRTDASKVALVAAVRSLFRAGIELFEVQMVTPHLRSLGAVAWPRARYLRALERARVKCVDLRFLTPQFETDAARSGL